MPDSEPKPLLLLQHGSVGNILVQQRTFLFQISRSRKVVSTHPSPFWIVGGSVGGGGDPIVVSSKLLFHHRVLDFRFLGIPNRRLEQLQVAQAPPIPAAMPMGVV